MKYNPQSLYKLIDFTSMYSINNTQINNTLQILFHTEDNFFECGGDSLLALQLIDEIERGSGRRISIAAVFDAPTPLLLSNYFTPERHI